MAIPCNAFGTNTVGATQQTAACKAPHIANLEDDELLPEQFLLLVLDSLQRLAALAAAPASIVNSSACDVAEALRVASCAMLTNTPAFPLTIPQLQGLILWQLNQAICTA